MDSRRWTNKEGLLGLGTNGSISADQFPTYDLPILLLVTSHLTIYNRKSAQKFSETSSDIGMCIHKCYNFRCGHSLFVPGAKVVCDLAIVALLVPPPGTSEGTMPESNLSPDDQQEAANVSLPQSPEPGHRHQNEEDLGVGRLQIKGFSRVCTPRAHGCYSNNIERLCSNCSRERDERRELAELKLIEAQRRASQLDTELEGEYATDHESMLSASDVETGSMISTKSPASSIIQQRRTSSSLAGLMNAFKRS